MPKHHPTDNSYTMPGMPLRAVKMAKATLARGELNAARVASRMAKPDDESERERAFDDFVDEIWEAAEWRP